MNSRDAFLKEFTKIHATLLVIEYRPGWPTVVYRQMTRTQLLAECRRATEIDGNNNSGTSGNYNNNNIYYYVVIIINNKL